jgi:hypothetical protein
LIQRRRRSRQQSLKNRKIHLTPLDNGDSPVPSTNGWTIVGMEPVNDRLTDLADRSAK